MNLLPPKVFISYSWDNPTHQKWVRSLARRLRENGIESIIDQWGLALGDQVPAFMEKAVRESNFILIICTERYKKRSDARQGGVGYEGDIMTAEVLNGANRRKFIPILRDGSREVSLPSWLQGSLFLDFKGKHNAAKFRELLQTLHQRREEAPDVIPSDRPQATAPRAAINLGPPVGLIEKQTEELLEESQLLEALSAYWAQLAKPYVLTNIGEMELKKWIRTYKYEILTEAMKDSATQYLRYDSNDSVAPTKESAAKAWSYVSRIAYAKQKALEKPHYPDIVKIRGILRNRLSYLRETDALEMLDTAARISVSIDTLRSIALKASSWTDWRTSMEEMIQEYTARSPV